MSLELELDGYGRGANLVIATRCVYRIVPLVLSKWNLNSGSPFEDEKYQLLNIFRACVGLYLACVENKSISSKFYSDRLKSIKYTEDVESSDFVESFVCASEVATHRFFRRRATECCSKAAWAVGDSAISLGIYERSANKLDSEEYDQYVEKVFSLSSHEFYDLIYDDIYFLDEKGDESELLEKKLFIGRYPRAQKLSWAKQKRFLLSSEQAWEVWTEWWEAIAFARPFWGLRRSQSLQLLSEIIGWPDSEWRRGPGHINFKIADLIEKKRKGDNSDNHILVDSDERPFVSAYDFDWTDRGTVTVAQSVDNAPEFPFLGGEREQQGRLAATRHHASRIESALEAQSYNAKPEYILSIKAYLRNLPSIDSDGNILIADGEARYILSIWSDEQHEIQSGLAALFKIWFEAHIALRAFYPAIEQFYRDVRHGSLTEPMPIVAVELIRDVVSEHTPTHFEPDVNSTLSEAMARPAEQSVHEPENTPQTVGHIKPPEDPLGDRNPEKARGYTVASALQKLWKVVQLGKKAGDAVEGWDRVREKMEAPAKILGEWLRGFKDGGV